VQQDPRLDLTLLASLALGMIFVGLVPSYNSVLQLTHSSLTPRPLPPPSHVHPCNDRIPSTRNWAFAVSARSVEPWFAREMVFGKLFKDPLPLHSLRPEDHSVTGRKSFSYIHRLPLSAHLWQTVFAFLASHSTTLDRMFLSILWIWLHLLQFCVSNQSLDPEEDSSNKPWRPIPSGLISVDGARNLRWMLLPFCLSVSVRLEAYWQGISLALAILAHNELGLHSHLFLRNICNAWGYASFNAGALTIASGTFSNTTCTAGDCA
jgi:hypothetical protein